MSNLSGRCVLVTRPDPEGSELCDALSHVGAVAIHFPTLAFAPPSDEQALQAAIAALGEQDWLIFISPQAVYASIPLIRRQWPQLPPRTQFAAIGAGTQKALHAAGYRTIVLPDKEWNSEGLLALTAFQSVTGKKIAIVRGDGGRVLLDKTLAERGAQVLPVIVYQRTLPQQSSSHVLPLLKQEKIDAAVCTSFESVQNLKTLLGEPMWPLLQRLPLIVMSERIKTLAHDLGFQTIWVTQRASNEAILAKLIQCLTQ